MGLLQIGETSPALKTSPIVLQKSFATPGPDTKETNPETKGTNNKIDSILQAAELFASSYGLRPYRLLIIRDKETKRKLQSANWNRQSSGSQSQLVVFVIDREITRERIDTYISEIAGRKKVSTYSFLSYKKYLESNINQRDKEGKSWAAKQVSLAAGNLLGAAARVKVKATVVDEAEAARLDSLLGLTTKKLTVALAILFDGITGDAPDMSSTKTYPRKDLVEYI